MVYISKQVKGKGRGKITGYPTINLEIPKGFHIKEGVYAAWVTIGHNQYKAALHYGPTPTFEESNHHLEFFLIDILSDNLENFYTKPIIFELVKFVRPVKKFDKVEHLSHQIKKDVEQITELLYQ